MTENSERRPILLRTERTGLRRLPDCALKGIEEAAIQAGYAVLKADLGECRNKASLLRTLGLAMRFPAWFGNNWDALADCITDMSWLPAAGYVIVLQRAKCMQNNANEDFLTALDILSEAADDWSARNVPMWVFVESGDERRIKLPDL
jgi:RNAse (barnase) inhibitor barstar